MSENVYKKVELIGTSKLTIEAAVGNAIATSNQSLRKLRWFEVNEIRGSVTDGQIDEWQVGVKLAFTIDSENSIESDSNSRTEAKSLDGPTSNLPDDPLTTPDKKASA